MARLSDKKKEEVVKKAKENVNTWFQYFADNIERYKQYTSFVYGDQWDIEETQGMARSNKIPLIVNKLYPIARRIMGEQRQNVPGLQVLSLTDGKDEQENQLIADSVSLVQNMINTKINESKSENAFKVAFKNALIGGFGAIEITSDYEDNKTFNQVPIINSILEPELCFFDPNAKEPGKSDGDFAGMKYYISNEKFEEFYPDVEIKPVREFKRTQLGANVYSNVVQSKDSVEILIYQQKEYFTEELILTKDGTLMKGKEYNEKKSQFLEMLEEFKKGLKAEERKDEELNELPRHLQIDKKRKIKNYKIMTYKIYKDEILEYSEWPSRYFSYIFCDQDSFMSEGKQVTLPFFYGAKDTQKMLNYLATQTIHLAKTLRHESFMATPSNMKGYEYEYTHPYLVQGAMPYHPDSTTGSPPIQLRPNEISPTITSNYDRFANDLQSSIGIYDAYNGNQGNEISGIAIGQRVKQGNKTTFVVFDSVNEMITQVGRVILDLIPKLYDSTRSIAVSNNEGEARVLTINQPNPLEPDNPINSTQYDNYHIRIDPGSSSEYQKQEALEALRELFTVLPQAAPMVADLYAKNLPLPNTLQIVRRLATIVPPEVAAAGEGKQLPPQQPPQPNPIEQLKMLEMNLKQAELQLKQQENEQKNRQMDLEEQRLRMEAAREISRNQASELKAAAEVDKAKMEHEDSMTEKALKAHKHNLEVAKLHQSSDELLGR